MSRDLVAMLRRLEKLEEEKLPEKQLVLVWASDWPKDAPEDPNDASVLVLCWGDGSF